MHWDIISEEAFRSLDRWALLTCLNTSEYSLYALRQSQWRGIQISIQVSNAHVPIYTWLFLLCIETRVSSKQTKKNFGSNRNKPKLNLFRLIFGLFRKTIKTFFRFVSVCFGVSDPFRNNRNKHICFETKQKNEKKNIFSIYCTAKSSLKRSALNWKLYIAENEF
jgi:hypothetical protein